MKKILIGILVILMIVLLYMIFRKKTIEEHFAANDGGSNLLLTGLGANPLLDRNMSNVSVSPTSTGNIILGSPGLGCWSNTTNMTNASVVINLNNILKVTSIMTQGVKYFKLYFSKTDNNPQSYEEILYQDSTAILSSQSSTIFFSTDSFTNVATFNNLITQDGQPVFAQFIKIVPVNSTSTDTDTTLESSVAKAEGIAVAAETKANQSKIANDEAISAATEAATASTIATTALNRATTIYNDNQTIDNLKALANAKGVATAKASELESANAAKTTAQEKYNADLAAATAARTAATTATNIASGNTNTTIGPEGIKMEVFGIIPQNKVIVGGESLIGSAKLYDINGETIMGTNWISESNNLEPRLRIVFMENNVVTPKTIYSIIFSPPNNLPNQWVKEFSLTYSHNKSKLNETIYNIKGNINKGTNQVQYYFTTPIIATELLIRPTQSALAVSEAQQTGMRMIEILGSSVNSTQEQTLLDKNKQQYCTSDNPDGCGSVSDLLGKQAEIQQLCDALDLQDQIKENNQRIQKNRQYIMQLEDHDKKISNLENIVNSMKHLRMLRQQNTDKDLLDQKDKQTEIDAKLKELVAERQKSQSQFNVKLNIESNSTALENLEKKVNNAESLKNIGNNTAKTPLEGFTNYSSSASYKNVIPNNPDPFNNRWLEHKFQLKLEEKNSQGFIQPTMLERQFEQVMNQGYNYVQYKDNTNYNQRKPENQMNLSNKVFMPSDPGYAYENIKVNTCPQFFEDIALNSPTPDTNVKFIRQMK